MLVEPSVNAWDFGPLAVDFGAHVLVFGSLVACSCPGIQDGQNSARLFFSSFPVMVLASAVGQQFF